MSNIFKVGDEVIPHAKTVQRFSSKLTIGKVYLVVSISACGDLIHLFVDDAALYGFYWEDFEHYHRTTVSTALVMARQVATKVVAHASTGGARPVYSQQYDEPVRDAPDGMSYDEKKAKQRVTSVGSFNTGDVLVYRDGTATQTTLTVARCTATCLWFEETYSMPFLPNDFMKE